MITLGAEEAGRALGTGPLAAQVSGVSTDSRSLRPGDLFVALRGDRFDGHDFVSAALKAGASGAVVEARWCAAWHGSGQAGRMAMADWDTLCVSAGRLYPVDDTLAALGILAREVRRRSAAKVVAITGSVGKTGTKDLLAAMAGRTSRVVATTANQNNEVGVPLTLLEIGPDTELAIVEMGMRGRGQIEALAHLVEPDVGVVTNIHPVHLELLGTLENIAEAKAELLISLGSVGTAVIPADCAPLLARVVDLPCRVLRFGFGPGSEAAEVRGSFRPSMTSTAEGDGVLVLRWPDGQAEVAAPFGSRHRLENAVAAAAACYAAGLPMETSIAGVSDVRFTASRGDVVRLGGLVMINDTYNANPAAVRAALDDLVDLAVRSGGRPVAILGDMLELGPASEKYHREAGAYAAEAGVAALWGVGPLSRRTVEGFREAWKANRGLENEIEEAGEAGHVCSAAEASPALASLRPGDVVLLTASRWVGLEILVSRIVQQAAGGRWSHACEADANASGRKKE